MCYHQETNGICHRKSNVDFAETSFTGQTDLLDIQQHILVYRAPVDFVFKPT
jgi:hypothetical protein